MKELKVLNDGSRIKAERVDGAQILSNKALRIYNGSDMVIYHGIDDNWYIADNGSTHEVQRIDNAIDQAVLEYFGDEDNEE